MHTGFWWGNVKEVDHLEDLGIGGRIILKWIFEQWGGGIDRIDLTKDRWQVAVLCGRSNVPLSSIKCGQILE